jgi:thiol-disulfide isomerase/thioredoxin
MKLTFAILYLTLSFNAFSQKFEKYERFNLIGAAQNLERAIIFIEYVNKNEKICLDSFRIKNGTFNFTGSVNRFYKRAKLILKKSGEINEEFLFGLENSAIKINITKNDLRYVEIIGNNSEREVNQFYLNHKRLLKLEIKDKHLSKSEIESYSNSLLKRMVSKICKTSPSKNSTTFLLFDNTDLFNETELPIIFNTLPKSQSNSYYGKKLNKIVTNIQLRKSQIGDEVENFSFKDYYGNDSDFYSLSQKGLVLIDFWASWCNPCRKAHPTLIQLYNKYNSKGFNILSISADTNNEIEVWRNAIAEDSISIWNHILSSAINQGVIKEKADLLKKFQIFFFPTRILVDSKNKIIKRFKKEEELVKTLEEIYGRNL